MSNASRKSEDSETMDGQRQRMLQPEQMDNTPEVNELNEDTTCGFWILKGSFLQKFATANAYTFLYGLVGCLFNATFGYFNATITTMEKRFEIPSRNSGIISAGIDMSSLFLLIVMCYYADKGHRPRWVAFGVFSIVVFCLMSALPHLLYGPGGAALALTHEFGASNDENLTKEVFEQHEAKLLCMTEGTRSVACDDEGGNLAPQVILLVAQLISGIGNSLYFSLGFTYMDDNVKKAKAPVLMSVSFFFKMLGPSVGYALASYCLKLYIVPWMTPVITNEDPRWLGAWWIGWIVMGFAVAPIGLFIALFPRELPKTAARRKSALKLMQVKVEDQPPASVKDMIEALKRITKNTVLMLNNIGSAFYIFGYLAYMIYTPKYIEVLYKQTASTASMVTGSVSLVFSALGVLLAGIIITRYKPTARTMAAWNVLVGFLSVVGIILYTVLKCTSEDNAVIVNPPALEGSGNNTCNSACQCDFIEYSPVCGEDGNTYLSACHAGCQRRNFNLEGKVYEECLCIESKSPTIGGAARAGSCPVDCQSVFVVFVTVMCFVNLILAAGRASNTLVSLRCVEPRDKTISTGLGLTIGTLSVIPSPIFFGMVLDKTCLVWGKNCSGEGNCWVYDEEALRYMLNYYAAAFVLVGTLIDCAVWYYVKDLKVFDEKPKEQDIALSDVEKI
ncbi:solute carrier organic anion transporter family member 1C1-like isoform X2 [Wyeomyia smithii]|uniref:solute carrier organic anion transporter family member 1C1-like isoform X2 n=1 Tax=Wyeomyia smithii TaxID=174621 RepID=UPI002467DE46|nr:solute carrier organic anion transporter family member 1C1-like isoform X2 [Wyeomyia smithii]